MAKMSLDNNLKKWALRILAYILTAVIIIWMIIIFKNHLGDFRVVKSISANMIFALAITSLLSFFLQGLIFKIIVEPYHIKLSFFEWFGLGVLNYLGNMFLPFGGWGVRAWYLKKHYQFHYTNFLSVLAAVSVLEFLIFSVGGLIGLGWRYLVNGSVNLSLISLFTGVLIIALLIILSPFEFKQSSNKFFKHFFEISQSWHNLRRQKSELTKIAFLMIIYFLTNTLLFFLAFQIVGIKIPFIFAFIPNCLSDYSFVIRILPASFGFYEGAVVYSTKILNATVTQGLLVAEIVRAANFGWLIIFGPIFGLFLKSRKN
jgi:uncharacterized membrane protein YbhN (UPF0104 family)